MVFVDLTRVYNKHPSRSWTSCNLVFGCVYIQVKLHKKFGSSGLLVQVLVICTKIHWIYIGARVDQLLVLGMGDLRPLVGNPHNGAL